jgi:hypothetical protein
MRKVVDEYAIGDYFHPVVIDLRASEKKRSSASWRRRKRKSGYNPRLFYDVDGRPTSKFRYLILLANFPRTTESLRQWRCADPDDDCVWATDDDLSQSMCRWASDDRTSHGAAALRELARLVDDYRILFAGRKSPGDRTIPARDKATVFAIQAMQELLGLPEFDSKKSRRPSLSRLKKKALELWAVFEPPATNVHWTSLLRCFRGRGFLRAKIGRPANR